MATSSPGGRRFTIARRSRLSPLSWYRKVVQNGLMGADAVVAPSAWMLDRITASYGCPQRAEVIYPGRNPIFFNPYVSKDDCVLSVGRLVDASKQVFLLTQQPHPLPVCIVGAEQTIPMPRIPIRADVKIATEQTTVAIRGPQTDAQLRALYSRASIYAATSRYEPLGMPALEAAFSRCAIVANDIPSFREVWGDAVLYFRTNDSASLAENIRLLNEDRAMRRAYAELAYSRARERFTTKRMIDQCLAALSQLDRPALSSCLTELPELGFLVDAPWTIAAASALPSCTSASGRQPDRLSDIFLRLTRNP